MSSCVITKYPRQADWYIYKERNLIETFFLKRKNNRRFATGYEKKQFVFRLSLFMLVFM